MTSLAILSFVAGAVLGLCFRLSVLALATSLGLIVVIGAGAVTEVNPWWVGLEALVVWVCLQLGYIPGVLIATYAAARKSRDRDPPGKAGSYLEDRTRVTKPRSRSG